MKKLSNTEAELKKALLIKKACISRDNLRYLRIFLPYSVKFFQNQDGG